MTATEIDDAAAAKEASNSTRGLPRLVQLLARKTPGLTHGARESIEERRAWESAEIARGQPGL